MSPYSYESSENVVHHSLEGGGAVGHSKEHHEGFKETTIGAEGHLPFISGLDAHIVEPPPDVKFCEVLGSAELGDEFGDEGERIPVFDSVTPLENFLWKCNIGYILYPWISLLESTLETSYKPQT